MIRKFITGEIYHVLNRGVEKRKIFLDDFDHFRFIHDLFEFNDKEPALNSYYYHQSSEVRPRKIGGQHSKQPRKLLVEILAFCLMPNHFHLLLRQKIDGGVSLFMQKLGTGYSMYFNQKYKRVGSLFQGRFKAVDIKNESHFIHIPYYIHLNPLDLITPEWRNRELKNFNEAINFLKKYRWSSYLDYIGQKNFPSVTQREFLLNFFGGSETYQKEMLRWLKDLDLNDEIKKITLE